MDCLVCCDLCSLALMSVHLKENTSSSSLQTSFCRWRLSCQVPRQGAAAGITVKQGCSWVTWPLQCVQLGLWWAGGIPAGPPGTWHCLWDHSQAGLESSPGAVALSTVKSVDGGSATGVWGACFLQILCVGRTAPEHCKVG